MKIFPHLIKNWTTGGSEDKPQRHTRGVVSGAPSHQEAAESSPTAGRSVNVDKTQPRQGRFLSKIQHKRLHLLTASRWKRKSELRRDLRGKKLGLRSGNRRIICTWGLPRTISPKASDKKMKILISRVHVPQMMLVETSWQKMWSLVIKSGEIFVFYISQTIFQLVSFGV